MTVEMFLIILTVCATVTSLFTEAVKKLLNSLGVKYVADFIVLLTSVFVGGGATAAYYIIAGCEWTAANIVFIFIMIFANWLGAMVGYEKVTQIFTQFKTK